MIIVRRTYRPNPGSGGRLLKLVREASSQMASTGFPEPVVMRAWHGGHGTVYTDQRWDSIAQYEESREAVRQTAGITSVFEQIYPLLAETHDTQILEIAG